MKIGDIVTVHDGSYSLLYSGNGKLAHADGIALGGRRWCVLLTDATLPADHQDMQNDIMLCEKEAPEHILFTQARFCSFVSRSSKPTYKVTRIDDRLQLDVKTTDGFAICKVRMANPSAVTATIAQWERDYDIDADEARRLAAEPKKLADADCGHWSAVAYRLADGWTAYIPFYHPLHKGTEMHFRFTEEDAIGLFPDIEGPYLEQP